MSGSNKLTAIEDWVFTQRRISFYGLGIAVAYLLSLAWRLVHGQWLILPDGRLRCVDFGWMWLSGRFAVSGDPAQIFDYSTFSAAQIALFGQGNCPFITPYVYPPTYLFMTYFLGFVPYLIAFGAWVLATLFLYGTAVYTIIPRRAAVIAAMCPFCVAVNADFGHNGFITAALIGFSLAFLERRAWLSGNILGPPQLQAAYRRAVPARASGVPELASPRERDGGDRDLRHRGGVRLWFRRLGVLFSHAPHPPINVEPGLCGSTRLAFSFWFASLGGDERAGFMGRTPHQLPVWLR